MDASTSLAIAKRQLETLKRELRICKENQMQRQHDEVDYRSLVENANEAILVAQNGFFKYANPKAEDLFGYSQTELRAQALTTFIHPHDREMVRQQHERRIKGEELPEL